MLIMIYPLQNDNPYKIPTNTILQYKDTSMSLQLAEKSFIYLTTSLLSINMPSNKIKEDKQNNLVEMSFIH